MTDKQPLQPAKNEPQSAASEFTDQEQISPLFSITSLSRQALPPLKPRNQQILQLQRLIGNHATQRYLRPAVPITTGASSSALQLDRILVSEIDVALTNPTLTYDAFVTLVAQNPSLRARMVSRSDDGSHILSTLRDHSNLQAIYDHIHALSTAGTPVDAVHLTVQFHMQDTPRTDGERVSEIEFAAPDLPPIPTPAPAPVVAPSAGPDSPAGAAPAAPEPPEYGLETSTSRDAYVADAASTLIPQWGDLTSLERVQTLFRMVNSRLTAIGVPEVTWEFVDLPADTGAQFGGTSWAIEISEARFSDDLTPAQINHLIADVYHEARHVEQAFLAIRYIYENFRDEWRHQFQDNHLGTYPTVVLVAALGAGPMSAQERIEARMYFEELFVNTAITQAIYDARDEAFDNRARVRASSPTAEELQAAEERYNEADAAYMLLNREVDAYDVGNEVEGQLNAPTPAP